MNAFSRCITILLVTLLLGCQAFSGVSHKYPDEWPKTIEADHNQCPDISGLYLNNDGICKYPSLCESKRLYSRLTNQSGAGNAVLISKVNDAELIIRLKHNEKITGNNILKEGSDYKCEGGSVWFGQGKSNYADDLGYIDREFTMGFRKAEDGSLIGQHRNSGWGLAMWLVPVGGTQILWYKWDETNN